MFTFNSQEHQPMKEFEPLPNGNYVFITGNAELTNSKSGAAMIKIVFLGFEPKASSSKLTEYFVVGHNDDKVREIACSKLRSVCDAIGVSTFDERTLHKLQNKKIVLKIGQSTYKNNDGDTVPSNKIIGFAPVVQATVEQGTENSRDLWGQIDGSGSIADGSITDGSVTTGSVEPDLTDDEIPF